MALDRLLGAVDGLLADLDALDGDADFEPALGAPERHPAIYTAFDTLASTQAGWAAGGDCEEREEVAEDEGAQCEGGGGDDACEDEGAQCEDEGHDSDSEPGEDRELDLDHLCNWQDEGDQTRLVPHRTYSRRPPDVRSPHENVGPLVRVQVL